MIGIGEKMSNNRLVRDLSSVLFSNGIVLIASILTGLVIPKFLSVADYGLYKIFNLYIGYTALLHFGFVDGILLHYAGSDYESLDQQKFRMYSHFFILFQVTVGLVFVLLAQILFKGSGKLIVSLIGIDTVVVNVTTYYQYISQSTLRFNELSIRKISQAIMRIVIICTLLFGSQLGFISHVGFSLFISLWISIDFSLVLWYIVTYRNITFGIRERLIDGFNDVRALFKDGITLTVAFQVSNLILTLDSQFVSMFFSTTTYAIYAFAYTLLSMANTVINAVSLVLFPNLRRMNRSKVLKEYTSSVALITLAIFSMHVGYFLLSWFIKWYLPEYADSLIYLRLIFPGLAITSCISAVIFTYYKLLDMTGIYFNISVIILAVAGLLNYFAYRLFMSPISITVSSLVVLFVWYIVTQVVLKRHFKLTIWKNTSYLLVMSTLFYVTTELSDILGAILFSIGFLSVTALWYRNLVTDMLHRVIRKSKTTE